MDETKLILPRLPENLESLHKEEERIRTLSILEIKGNEVLKAHMDVVHASMDTLYVFTHEYKNQTEEELVIQFLGIRLFNSIASSIALLLAGYYQNSALLIRDLIETGFLVDYFLSYPSKIQQWKNSNDKERKKNFGPAEIRKALDNRDKATQKKRAQIYEFMSEYAAHPTYKGFKLIARQGLGQLGPFFDPRRLKVLVEEFAKHLPCFTLTYCCCS